MREVFAPTLGIIAGLLATLTVMLRLIFGRFKTPTLPVEPFPGASRVMLNILIFAPLTLGLLTMNQEAVIPAVIVCCVAGVLTFVCLLRLGKAKAGRIYIKPVARKFQRVLNFFGFKVYREEIIIGGANLKADAAKEQTRLGVTTQELLKSAGYDPEKLWTAESQADSQNRIQCWYYAFMFLAVMTIVIAALALQTDLSGQSPRDAAKQVWAKTHR